MDTSQNPQSRPRILIADDADIGRQIVKTLISSDFDVVEARNGLEAIRILTNSPGSFAGIISDVNMPVMDGYRVLMFLREQDLLGRIPVIFVTAATDDDTISRCFEAGATDVIVKPLSPKTFLPKIRAIVSYVAGQNASATKESKDSAYFMDILDAIPDAVFATDPETHAIKFCNAAFLDLPGMAADPVGHHIRKVFPANVAATVNAVWEDIVLRRIRSTRYFRFPSDPRVWRISYNALLNEIGEISDYVGNIADATQYVSAAPELETALRIDQNPESMP